MHESDESTPLPPLAEEADTQERDRFCAHCGTELESAANFCRKCGHRVRRTTPLSDEVFADLHTPEERVGDLLALAFRKREQGDLDAAVRACATALQHMPDSTSAHSLMGMLHEEMGEREKAIAAFEKVLALNPGSIADREKLEQLRDSASRLTPRRITPARRSGISLFDSPAAAAVAAVAVFLIVLLIGAYAIWSRDRQRAASAADRVAAVSSPAAPVQAAPLPSGFAGPATSFTPAPQAYAPQPAQPEQQPQASPQTSLPSPQEGAPHALQDTGVRREVPPAPVELRIRPAESARPSPQTPPSTETSVILPDNGLGPSEVGPAPGTGQRLGISTQPQNQGKIEIVVSRDELNPSGKSADSDSAPNAPAAPSMDSRSRRAVAQQAQYRGDYQTAAREYLKALDGAGDDAAIIHQQIGLCYQRLSDKDGAIAHYNDAINEYRKLIAAGRRVESANRGIRACESSIRALQ